MGRHLGAFCMSGRQQLVTKVRPADTTIDPVALAAFVEAYARAIIAEAAAEPQGRAA